MRAIIIACPTEELLYFPAALSTAPPTEVLLLSVLSSPPGAAGIDHSKGLFDFSAERGFVSENLRQRCGRDGRLLPEPLSELFREVLQKYGVGEVYTYAIQGDKGRRYRADVAMAVWLATQGRRANFIAKHTTRITQAMHMPPETVVSVHDSLVRHYLVDTVVADTSISHAEIYTSHTYEEAKTAYYELSHGLEGVKRLAGEGDPDPWGYRYSDYARGRCTDTLWLVEQALGAAEGRIVWEIGPGSGHITERLLSSPQVDHVTAVERYEEFRQCLLHHLGTSEKLSVRQEDMREIGQWECDVAVLVDCLDFYLSEQEQQHVVLHALSSGTRVIVGGEAVWASTFVERLTAEGGVIINKEVSRPGAFEPIRLGFPIHCYRPAWAAYLLSTSG